MLPLGRLAARRPSLRGVRVVVARRSAAVVLVGQDRVAHAIDDSEFATGARCGTYRARCGAFVLPAALSVTAVRTCVACHGPASG